MPRRAAHAGFGPSPLRRIYCKLDDITIVLPLDICLLDEFERPLRDPLADMTEGVFFGAEVRSSGGARLGTIPDGGYEWPTSPGDIVRSFVIVEGEAADFVDVKENTNLAVGVSQNDRVKYTKLSGMLAEGTIIEDVSNDQVYPEPGFTTRAYKVRFDEPIGPQDVGVRILGTDDKLVGMLISISLQDNQEGLVCPADIIHR